MGYTRFRLYVGLTDRAGHAVDPLEVGNFVVLHFTGGVSFYPATGLWGGKFEATRVLEIIRPTGPEHELKVRNLAIALRDKFNQSVVLMTSEPVHAEQV